MGPAHVFLTWLWTTGPCKFTSSESGHQHLIKKLPSRGLEDDNSIRRGSPSPTPSSGTWQIKCAGETELYSWRSWKMEKPCPQRVTHIPNFCFPFHSLGERKQLCSGRDFRMDGVPSYFCCLFTIWRMVSQNVLLWAQIEKSPSLSLCTSSLSGSQRVLVLAGGGGSSFSIFHFPSTVKAPSKLTFYLSLAFSSLSFCGPKELSVLSLLCSLDFWALEVELVWVRN